MSNVYDVTFFAPVEFFSEVVEPGPVVESDRTASSRPPLSVLRATAAFAMASVLCLGSASAGVSDPLVVPSAVGAHVVARSAPAPTAAVVEDEEEEGLGHLSLAYDVDSPDFESKHDLALVARNFERKNGSNRG